MLTTFLVASLEMEKTQLDYSATEKSTYYAAAFHFVGPNMAAALIS
jgi:hypothetical protein